MWGNPTLLDLLKKYWQKIINYWLWKVNTDTINLEKLSDRFADHKYNDATCRNSLTLISEGFKYIGWLTLLL